MKILSIKLCNLASLAGEYTIDFQSEPLSSAGIFAITGPTGAGKSTILDAICLALFAKTPRQLDAKETGVQIADGNDKVNPHDARNILRKGTASGFAEVAFVGLDNVAYKSRWTVRRARNSADGSLQADTIELTNIDTNTKFKGGKEDTKEEIERLIGLNFEQFKRSVLLAQGDFTAFLKADKKEKAAILEKLTGTDIYSEISKLVFARTRDAEQEVKQLQSQVEGIRLLNEDEKAEINSKIEALNNNITERTGEQEEIKENLIWFDTYDALERKTNEAEQKLRLAKEERSNNEGRIRQYELANSVQDAQMIVDRRDEQKKSIAKKEEDLTRLIAEIDETNKATQKHQTAYDDSIHVLSEKEMECQNAQVSINKARELDTLLTSCQKNLEQLDGEYKEACQSTKKHSEKLKETEITCNQTTQKLKEITDWIEKNIPRRVIAENSSLILSKLEDGQKAHKKIRELDKESDTFKTQLQQCDIRIAELSDKLSKLEKSGEETAGEIGNVQNEMAKLKIDELQSFERAISEDYQQLTLAKGIWELEFRLIRDLEQLKEQLQKADTRLAENKKLLTESIFEKNKADQLSQFAHKMLSKAQLETAKDVVTLRSQLSEDEPCPVCGSKHHPYSGSNAPESSVLKELRKEYDEQNKKYEELIKQCSALESEITNAEKETVSTNNRIVDKQGELEETQQKWTSIKVYPAFFRIEDSQKQAWLEAMLRLAKDGWDTTKRDIDKFNRLSGKLRDSEIALVETRDNISALSQQKTGEEGKRETILALLGNCDKSKQAAKSDLNILVAELSRYFNQEGWFENWLAKPDDFQNKIYSFAREWNLNTGQLNDLKNEKTGLESALTQLGVQHEKLVADELSAKSKLDLKAIEQAGLANERNSIFNNRNIDTVESEFKDNISKSKRLADELKVELEELKIQAGTLEGRKKQQATDLETTKQALAHCENEVALYMQKFNAHCENPIDEPALIKLLNLSAQWLATENNWIQSIEDAIKSASEIWTERKRNLDEHLTKKISTDDRVILSEKLAQAEKGVAALNKERSDFQYQLRQDNDNKERAGSILAELIDKRGIYETRKKLCDLIGSADGEKFRQFAQEYTLDILIAHTNVHLKELTQRYKLERIPESLSLQVVDRDMGDEIRSVHSLSGGESFLVSLALALGLASLSSNRMKIESLFIDEGFGTLDPATLSVAMAALEKLHQTGRKVGIISHIQEMTIHTQIKVRKLANGKSALGVVG